MLRMHCVQLFYNLSNPAMEALRHRRGCPIETRARPVRENWMAAYEYNDYNLIAAELFKDGAHF